MDQTNNSTPTSKKPEGSLFSPVIVAESPVSKTPQRGNLTGNPRKIRDSAADIYNFVQEWNNNTIIGSGILSKINYLKCNSMKNNGIVNSDIRYPAGLQDLCEELHKTWLLMEDILKRMSTTKTEVAAVIKLEAMKNPSGMPMFLTWPPQKFDESLSLILNSYETELSLKKHIKENIAHVTTEADLMFYVASWAHQPYIDSCVDITLESLLKETGHR